MNAYEISDFGIDDLHIVEREVPRPAEDEVLIRFHAASLNYRDVMVVSGTYNPRMKLPAVPFSDGAGEIVEIGSKVTKWSVGDRVSPNVVQGWVDGGPTADASKTAIGAGTYAGVLRGFGAFSEDAIVKVPEHLSLEEGATLPCAAVTAWHALVESGKVKAGDTVL